MTSWRFRYQVAHQEISDYGFWKGDPYFIFMFNWHFFVDLKRFTRYSTFNLAGLFIMGRNCGGFKTQCPLNVKWEENFSGRVLPYAKLRFEPLCVKSSLSVWLAQVRKKKWQEEKSQKVITRLRSATPSGRVPTKFAKCGSFKDLLKRAQFNRYKIGGFGVVRCWSFHVALTLCFALPRTRWWIIASSWVNYSRQWTEPFSEHYASNLSFIKADSLWCDNRRYLDSNPRPIDTKTSVLPTTSQHPTCSHHSLRSARESATGNQRCSRSHRDSWMKTICLHNQSTPEDEFPVHMDLLGTTSNPNERM